MVCCVPPALIIFVYHKTREEAGTLYQTNEDGSKFYFICSQTMKNIPMIVLFIAGGRILPGVPSPPILCVGCRTCRVDYEKSAG